VSDADREELARVWAQLHDQRALEREAHDLRARMAEMEASRSWRWTRPVRLVERYGPKALARLRELRQAR
jgi:hypothetical protein